MIDIPAIYADNELQLANDLLPPFRRLSKFLSWFFALLMPQQWLNDLAFIAYYGGANAPIWVTGTMYNYGDRVVYVDYSVYESVTLLPFVSTLAPVNDIYDQDVGTGNWIKVLDTFVGVGERVKYNGQKIMLEYLLNYYFSVGAISFPWTGADQTTQIYISNGITVGAEFWLSDGGVGSLTSYMAADSDFSTSYMGNAYTTSAFTIYVPTAVDAAITANQVSGVTAEDVIRAIADKYVQAGKLYNYATY